MGAWGAIIMAFFGSMFAALSMFWQWKFTGGTLAIPFIAFAAIGAGAGASMRLPGRGFTLSEKAERAIMWSSIAEGVALFVASQLVLNLHMPSLLLPIMALIVGLHFFPIALASSFHGYWLLGGALVMCAVVGFLIPSPAGGGLAGMAAAIVLWIAAILAVRRDWIAKRTPAS